MYKHACVLSDVTYFSVQTISPEVFGKFLHVTGETPEGVHLGVKDLKEPAAQVVHPLGVTDLWINRWANKVYARLDTHFCLILWVNKPEVTYLDERQHK